MTAPARNATAGAAGITRLPGTAAFLPWAPGGRSFLRPRPWLFRPPH
jgi:hypothetical protein